MLLSLNVDTPMVRFAAALDTLSGAAQRPGEAGSYQSPLMHTINAYHSLPYRQLLATPAFQRRCQANPTVVQHLPIRAFRAATTWQVRRWKATTHRRVMLAWRRSVVAAERCTPTALPRRAATGIERWNCQGWRCGFAFCGRVALDHIMADYERIQLAGESGLLPPQQRQR